MANFEDLSDDELYLILNHLRSERSSNLHCLRLVSKRLLAFADSVLYRKIVLEEHDEFQEQQSFRFIERLLDPADALRTHVRSLHVNSFAGDDQSSCMNVQLLVACLQSIPKLHSLSWDADIPLPDDLLHALHQRHPYAQLCVSTTHLDQAAVASSQLFRLDASINCTDIIESTSQIQFQQLREILIQASRLRELTIDIRPDLNLRNAMEREALDSAPQHTGDPRLGLCHAQSIGCLPSTVYDDVSRSLDMSNETQLRLEPTDRLPPLEELAIKATAYSFDQEHCMRLRECIDWTKLKRLILGTPDATIFFEVFTGKIPLLEHLDFSISPRPHKQRRYIAPPYAALYPAQASLTACIAFISSTNALKSLVVRCDTIDFSDHFWSTLARIHGEHLQHLSIQPRFEGSDAPSYKHSIRGLLVSLTSLRTLELALSTSSRNWGPKHHLGTEYIDDIPLLVSLERLRISVRITQWNEWSLHQYIVRHAHCAIKRLWAFYADQPDRIHDPDDKPIRSRLEVFSLQFWRWETPSAHAEQNGLARSAHINKVVFDSMRQGHQLVVRARERTRSMKTYYDSVCIERKGPLTSYFPVQQASPGQLFILSDRSRSSGGTKFR